METTEQPKKETKQTGKPLDSRQSILREFFVAVCAAHGATYREKVSDDTLSVFESALADIPAEDFRDALNSTIRNVVFWPTPAHVRQQWESLHAKREQAASEKAWDGILEHVRKWGIEQTPMFHNGEFTHAPTFDDVTEFACRQVGGYRAIASAPVDQLRFMRREFTSAYGRYRETAGYLAPTRAEAGQILEKLSSDSGISLGEIGTLAQPDPVRFRDGALDSIQGDK